MKFTKIIPVILFSVIFSTLAIAAPYQIKDLFNAEDYNANAQLDLFWMERFFLKNYKFTGKEKVLEIGSADGKIAARISSFTPNGKVLGIDISESMVNFSNNKYIEVKNLSFMLRDAEDSSFYDENLNEFDVIVSFSTINWITDQKTVLEGIYRSLKKDGKFYLRFSAKGPDPVLDIADKLTKSKRFKEYFTDFTDPTQRFTAEEYKTLLDDAKLHVISLVSAAARDKIDGIDNFMKHLKSGLPQYLHLRQSDQNIADDYIERLANIYLNTYPPKDDGTIFIYERYLEVVGSRE